MWYKARSGTKKLQSAMEFLMTYGWSVLAIAVILGVMYQLGVFSQPSSGNTCTSTVGYFCVNPILTNNGLLSVTIGQISGGTITITGTACVQGSAAPTVWTPTSILLPSSGKTSINFGCQLAPSAPLGTPFTGVLWIQYNQGAQVGIGSQVGIINVQVEALSTTSTTSSTTSSTTTIATASCTYNDGGGSSTGSWTCSGATAVCNNAVCGACTQGTPSGNPTCYSSSCGEIGTAGTWQCGGPVGTSPACVSGASCGVCSSGTSNGGVCTAYCSYYGGSWTCSGSSGTIGCNNNACNYCIGGASSFGATCSLSCPSCSWHDSCSVGINKLCSWTCSTSGPYTVSCGGTCSPSGSCSAGSSPSGWSCGTCGSG